MKKFGSWCRVAALAAAVAFVVLVAATTTGATTPRPASARATKAIDAYITYYGWFDNTPPGCSDAYHSGCASGTGSYKHPIPFASSVREFRVGAIVYYPTVEKYFRMEDDCQECDEDWAGKGPDGGPGLYHLDLWIGGRGGEEADVISCEDALTQALPSGKPLLSPLILNPPPNLPTSTEQLFDSQTNACFGGARTATWYGRYENKKTRMCLADYANGSVPGTPAVAAPCSRTAADQDLAFHGAFFSVNHLCLTAEGSKVGAGLDFVTCSGAPRQLWETGSGGRISWVQYLECISDAEGRIELASCNLSRSIGDNQWIYVAEPLRKPR